MARQYFVSTATKKLGEEYGFTEGDWIEVKNALSYGEGLHLTSSTVDEIRQREDGTNATKFDLKKFKIDRILLYVVAWSVRTASGAIAKIDRVTVEELAEDIANEIDAALDKHVAELNEAKNSKGQTKDTEIK